MNPNILKAQFFCKMKYDLKSHVSSNKTFKPTVPLCFPKIMCAFLSPIPTKKGGGRFTICSLDVQTQIFQKVKNDIKARFNEATFMLWRGCVIFKNVPIF